MKKHLRYNILFILLSLVSCNKFLDVMPKGKAIPTTLSDYDELLNMYFIQESFSYLIQQRMPDDVYAPTLNVTSVDAAANLYFFRGKIDQTPDDRALIWEEAYGAIESCNLITSEVMQATTGTIQEKKSLFAQATVLKSFDFLLLATVFSPEYNPQNPNAGFGVPLINSVDPNIPIPQRLPLGEFMTTLITNIKSVISDLPDSTSIMARPNKQAAYALLSRIYLYTGDFGNAEIYADSVISIGRSYILDYNNFETVANLPRTFSSPEQILYKTNAQNNIQFSKDLQALFTSNDLRVKLFVKIDANGNYTYNPTGASPPYVSNTGITYAEVVLTKAECLARAGKTQEAMNFVNNNIRKKRFSVADYTALTAENSDEAIQAILDERRRELAFKGVRWFDMKRLDAEGRMPEVNRYDPNGQVLATLQPHAKEYTIQIPLKVQRFNPNIILN